MAEESNNIEQKIVLNYQTNANETAKEVNVLVGATEDVTEAQKQNDTQTQKSEEGYKSFKTQIREATQDLMKMSAIYGESSKEAVEAAKKVAELKDQMGFAKDLVDKFNPDQKFKALGAATQLATNATTALVSGMALFGDQSQKTQETLLKVQAAMAFSESITNLSELGDQWKLLKSTITSSTLVQNINTASTVIAGSVMKLFGAGVDTTSKSFKGLKAAIIGTGIGALVVALGLIINNFDEIKKVVLRLVPGLSAVGDTIMNIVNSVTDFIGVTSEADRALDRLKANADASIALNKKFLAEHGDQLDEFTKKKIEAKNAYSEAIKEDGANQTALAKRLNRELAAIEYSRGDEARKLAKDEAEKAAEQRKKDREKAAADAETKKKEALKKLEEEYQARQQLIREQAEKAREEYEAAVQLEKDIRKANEDSLKTENELKVEKENEEFAKKIETLKAAGLSTEEAEKEHKRNIAALNDEYYAEESDKSTKRDAEAKEKADKIAADKIQNEKNIQDAIASITQNGISLVDSLEQLGLRKSKATEGIRKGLALTQIAADSAVAVSKAIPMALQAGKEAAAVAGPAAPVVGPLVTAASLIGSTATIAKNVASAKKILQGGSVSIAGGGGGSAPSSTPIMSSAAPQVGFQASAENNIATTIAANTNAQPPVQAFVVSTEVTTAQALDRKKVSANSF